LGPRDERNKKRGKLAVRDRHGKFVGKQGVVGARSKTGKRKSMWAKKREGTGWRRIGWDAEEGE